MKKDNIKYFSDCTYYCIPPQCKSLKMWILLAYNKILNKIIICNISLIKNENFETFDVIIKYLKIEYNFNPSIMTVDFNKAAFKAFKLNFNNIRFVPFFSFFQRIYLKLPQLKDKKKY